MHAISASTCSVAPVICFELFLRDVIFDHTRAQSAIASAAVERKSRCLPSRSAAVQISQEHVLYSNTQQLTGRRMHAPDGSA